jgi:hypothetical protein
LRLRSACARVIAEQSVPAWLRLLGRTATPMTFRLATGRGGLTGMAAGDQAGRIQTNASRGAVQCRRLPDASRLDAPPARHRDQNDGKAEAKGEPGPQLCLPGRVHRPCHVAGVELGVDLGREHDGDDAERQAAEQRGQDRLDEVVPWRSGLSASAIPRQGRGRAEPPGGAELLIAHPYRRQSSMTTGERSLAADPPPFGGHAGRVPIPRLDEASRSRNYRSKCPFIAAHAAF